MTSKEEVFDKKRFLVLTLSLILCQKAFAALAEDYSAYSDEELTAISAAVNKELDIRREAARGYGSADDFNWATNGSEVKITKYRGVDGNILIPDEIDGIPVTWIGENAFNENIIGVATKSVRLPGNLRQIDKQAFWEVGEAWRAGENQILNFPATLETIGQQICTYSGFGGVVINSDVKINQYAFAFSWDIGFLYIREGASPEIGAMCFDSDSRLELAIIPASVTSIGQGAFNGCTSLKIITPAGSAAEAYAKENWIPVETDTYELYVAQYNALYPIPE